MGKKKHKEKVLKLPLGTYRVTEPIRARKIVGTGPPSPPLEPPQTTTTISNVYANTTGTDRPFAFIELGRENTSIRDCTIFGPDPALKTLVRSWAYRRYRGNWVARLLEVR